MQTPEQQITPDFDVPMKPCNDCNGCGETIEWDEDDQPEPVRCVTCGGTGEVECDIDEIEDYDGW
jgi:hypothetical protein